MDGTERDNAKTPAATDAQGDDAAKVDLAAEAAAQPETHEHGMPMDAAAMAERLVAVEAEAAKFKDDYLRALAEIENVRRRAARDRQEASQYAISGFARDLLSVADNLRRALASVEADARQRDPALDALMSGVEMTEKELLTVFERYGIKPIAAEGQPFDPHVHEALFEIPNPSVPNGIVLQVVQAGYMLHDRPLRPARVGIAKGGPKPGTPSIAASVSDADDSPKPSPISEDDGVIEFPTRGGAKDAYRKPGEDKDECAGSRVDETH
jgi:molecular chaperone GrpE